MANKGTIEIGPWGGEGGVKWDFFPSSTNSSITEINIGYEDVIDSLSFKSIDRTSGKTKASPTYGGKAAVNDQISIDGSTEYLTSISGTTTDYKGNVVVESLTFTTNTNTKYGPYGSTSTNSSIFNVPIENGEVVGFFGRASASKHINAIGIQVTPRHN